LFIGWLFNLNMDGKTFHERWITRKVFFPLPVRRRPDNLDLAGGKFRFDVLEEIHIIALVASRAHKRVDFINEQHYFYFFGSLFDCLNDPFSLTAVAITRNQARR